MSEPVTRRYPVRDGEMELTTEIVSQNDDNTTTVKQSLRVTKPITIAVFSVDGEPVTDGRN